MALTRPRRTQEERRAETRGKLLDATIASLLDGGYPATTTRRVAELAGVSAGAMTHHFPLRVDLVGAAIERLAGQRVEFLGAQADSLPPGRPERTRAALDLLWNDFSSDLFTIFVKLWVAAADDPELYERLVPLERKMARQIAASLPSFVGDRVTVALATMRGLALSVSYEPGRRARRDPWPPVRAQLEALLNA
jgi:AcrR family transcriptional regulator